MLAILGMTGAAVCFKFAADRWDEFPVKSVTMFLVGTLVSLLHPIGSTIALRGHNANVVFATIGGPGLVATQLALACVFRYPLAWWQWAAVAIIVLGVVLLQDRPPKPEATIRGSKGPEPCWGERQITSRS